MRRSKRKRSSRDDYMLREQLKIEEGMFDMKTVIKIGKLFGTGIISKFYFRIATGKEADVYLAEPGSNVQEDFIVLKIFRIETTSFKDRMKYIIGDPRFSRVKKNMYSVVNTWCKKEYGNLQIAQSAGVRAPKPFAYSGNVLAMEFIGNDGKPAAQLKESGTETPEKTLDSIIEEVKKLYDNDLVHADLSEYNVLMLKGIPYLIDFGQAVVLEHANATEFLHRDIKTILTYFEKKYGIIRDENKVFEYVTKEKKGQSGTL